MILMCRHSIIKCIVVFFLSSFVFFCLLFDADWLLYLCVTICFICVIYNCQIMRILTICEKNKVKEGIK